MLAVLGTAALIGAAASVQPVAALAPFAAVALVAFAFLAPVAHLMTLLAVTAVVGYALQHKLGSHLLPSDALLVSGLVRAFVITRRQRLERRQLLVLALMSAFLIATLLQVVHGLRSGYGFSEVGDEGRDLLGFGALLIALPILNDAHGSRRLARGLAVVGLLLGVWGLGTWALGISFGENVDIGVRSSAGFAVTGNGQLHGGLYAYPIAVIMAATALLTGQAGRGWRRWWIVAVLVTNTVCLLLTYERTFWMTTVLTLAFVVAKCGRGRRLRAAVTIVATGLAVFGLLATVSPGNLSKIEARVLTLGQAQTDDSVRYRVVETGYVLHKIKARPWLGWGLGDTIYWGQFWNQVPPRAAWFSHNGYLWVIWKIGIIPAALLFGLLAWAIAARASPDADPVLRSLRVGAQGGLLVLALSSVTFPSFNSITITATMGVLLAICLTPRQRSASGRF
jgi:hypothetical protein